ncbi:MAG: phosphatase PAP2 family protein [Verrucomicrobiota bacterium]|nr:phosphatase PAP2 family protein [Verrucomicrobiota bacterium]
MKHYLFIDYATQGYMAVVAVVILLFHNQTTPWWPWLLLAHVAGIAFVHFLIQAHSRKPSVRWLDFLRHYYPIPMYIGFYRETGLLNRLFFPDYLDAFFIQLDERIFGFQPCLEFMYALPHLWVSEVFYAAYFTYYIMISGIGLALYLRDKRQFFHYVSVVSFVFYICYLVYICLPVMGPRAFFREIDGFRLPDEIQAYAGAPFYPPAVQSGLFFQIMAWIYRNFEGPGAAFPSSHVAIAFCTLWFSFRYLPKIRCIHLIDVILLCLSTVYCRYHYAVDVAGGAVAAAVLVPLANRLYWAFSGLGANQAHVPAVQQRSHAGLQVQAPGSSDPPG